MQGTLGERELDLRDSRVQDRDNMTRKGRVTVVDAAFSELQRQHSTPWGEPLGNHPEFDAPKIEPGLRVNHFQNVESDDTAGTYSVPDTGPAHNHFQNSETGQKDGRLKMISSKINEGEEIFEPADLGTPGAPIQKGKVALGTSKINSGHDIFGSSEDNTLPANSNFKEQASPAPSNSRWTGSHSQGLRGGPNADFQDRPVAGHVKSPWPGYTNAGNRSGKAGSTQPW